MIQNIFLTREEEGKGGDGGDTSTTSASASTSASSSSSSSSCVGACLRRLQKLEGEKLLLVAAQHMDLIQLHYPAFAPHMGAGAVGAAGGRAGKASLSGGEDSVSATTTAAAAKANSEYNTKKKLECEEKIREEMENIMSEKCDLMSSVGI